MGAYTCPYGTVHKMCRCPTPHSIPCPTPDECAPAYKGRHRADVEPDSGGEPDATLPLLSKRVADRARRAVSRV